MIDAAIEVHDEGECGGAMAGLPAAVSLRIREALEQQRLLNLRATIDAELARLR